MKKTVILIYKNFHTDERKEITYFETFEDAEREASRMIEQFKYWGGGSAPIMAIESIQTRTRGYKEVKSTYYPEKLYILHARENGADYGYYKEMHKKELKKTV